MREFQQGNVSVIFTDNFSRGEVLKFTVLGTVRLPMNLPGMRLIATGITRLASGLENGVGSTRRELVRTIFQSPYKPLDPQELVKKYIGEENAYECDRANARLQRSGIPVWALMGYHRAGCTLKQVAADFAISIEEIKAAFSFYQQNKDAIDGRLDGRFMANERW